MIDWTQCDDVEQVPGRLSGVPVVKGTRIPVQGLLDNAEELTPEEIVDEVYEGLGLERARRIIAFARAHEPHPA